MAGIFDYQDPDSVGRMMFAAGLLNAAGPSKMPVSVGQALSQGLLARQQGASEAAQNARRNAFMDAQTRKLLSEAESGGKKPAALQVFEAYAAMTPEQRAIFDHTNKAQIVDVAGIKYLRTPEGVIPLVSQSEAAGNARTIAENKAWGTAAGKAPWEVHAGVNNGQDVFATTPDILESIGRTPQIPGRLPNALGAPPQQMPQQMLPQIPKGTPPRIGEPNVPPPGINPDGYSNLDELRSYLYSQGELGSAPRVQQAFGSGIQPPAAGNAKRGQAVEESQATGKSLGVMYDKIQAAGFDAQGQLGKLDRFESLLSGIDTGKLTPIGTEIAGYMKSAGFDVDPNLPNKQAADSLSKEMALMLRKPGQQSGGMPGNFSDADRNFLVAIAPGLANTPGGNALIIQTLRKAAQREQEMAKLAFEYKQKNGTMDGFVQVAKAYADSHPLYAEESKRASAIQGGQQSVSIGTRRKTKDGRDVEFDGKGWKLVTP
jgi:hypothetical protein